MLVTAFEAASAEDFRLKGAHVQEPVYKTEDGYITPDSVEKFKEQLAEYDAFHQASALAEQALHTAQAALDAWFPAQVATSLDEGVALVAPAAEGRIALVKHNGAYIIERAATQEEALNKIERFLNQF
ncbi:hypothetical protein J4E00_07115 [Siccationidurans soli]|uniref:Uncharacterized protein n=2 Tax=Hymenobacter negativus TaxID=2795026 RepID=A0ABS3QC44_9BACT|nr:hypothetical protein [Hymenobacter negativus]